MNTLNVNVVELLACMIIKLSLAKDAKKEYELSTLEYDTCLSNYKTGWIFPMIKFSKGE